MARDSSGTKNQPHYSGTGAPSDAADLTEVADYAAAVGNRKSGTASQRSGLSGADLWVGLEFYETDTGATYIYTASGWAVLSATTVVASGTLTLGTNYSFSTGGALNQLRKRDTQVMLVLALDKSGTVAANDVVATLPAGFRPPALVIAGGFSTSSNAPVFFTISTAGAITVYFGSGSPANVRLHVVFETV